jgi:hypothetical protein
LSDIILRLSDKGKQIPRVHVRIPDSDAAAVTAVGGASVARFLETIQDVVDPRPS